MQFFKYSAWIIEKSTSDPALQLVKKKYLWKKKKKVLSDVVQKLSIDTSTFIFSNLIFIY